MLSRPRPRPRPSVGLCICPHKFFFLLAPRSPVASFRSTVLLFLLLTQQSNPAPTSSSSSSNSTSLQLYPILTRLSSTPADSAGWPDRPVHSLGQRADFGGWSGAVFQAGGRYTCLRLESDPAGEGGGEEGARAREGGSASVGCQKAPIANEMEDGAATSTTAAAKTTRLRTGQRGIRDAAPRRST